MPIFAVLHAIMQLCWPTSLKLSSSSSSCQFCDRLHSFIFENKARGRKKKILNMITYFLLLYIISHIMKLQLVKNTRNFVTFEFMTCPRIKRIVHRMRMKLKQLAGDTGQASKLIKFPFKLRGMLSISGFPTLSLLARAQSVGLLAKIVWRELDINVYDSWPTDLANFRVVSEVQIMAPNQRLFSKSFLYCRRN